MRWYYLLERKSKIMSGDIRVCLDMFLVSEGEASPHLLAYELYGVSAPSGARVRFSQVSF
jgi:hypothetical protein